MSHSRYLLWIFVASLLGWGSVALVMYRLDPYESTGLAMTLLFIGLFIALTATFALLGYFIRRQIHQSEIFYSHVNVALRQGLLLSVCSLACLFLLIFNALTWWSGLLIIVFITLIEFYISSDDK